MYETSKGYQPRYKCKGCTQVYSGDRESFYINLLYELGYNSILQQYNHESLESNRKIKTGRKSCYDIALLINNTESLPFFLIEVLSYHDYCLSNQDRALTKYVKKVLFAKNVLKIPLIEINYREEREPRSIINDAMEKYKTIIKLKDSKQFDLELHRIFYEPIIKRIGESRFNLYNLSFFKEIINPYLFIFSQPQRGGYTAKVQ